MRIIAFTGQAGSGKDTLCNSLLDAPLVPTIRESFAAPIYDIASIITDLSIEELHETKRSSQSIRELLERIGDFVRSLYAYERAMIDIMESKLVTQDEEIELTLINDLRTEEEAAWVRAWGGTVVHIQRPNNNYSSDSTHPTNRRLPVAEGDRVLNNSADLDSFITLDRALVHELLQQPKAGAA